MAAPIGFGYLPAQPGVLFMVSSVAQRRTPACLRPWYGFEARFRAVSSMIDEVQEPRRGRAILTGNALHQEKATPEPGPSPWSSAGREKVEEAMSVNPGTHLGPYE